MNLKHICNKCPTAIYPFRSVPIQVALGVLTKKIKVSNEISMGIFNDNIAEKCWQFCGYKYIFVGNISQSWFFCKNKTTWW